MSSVSKPQGADLAKINYHFLCQADPKAVLNVDSDGLLHALKNSNSVFQTWLGMAATPDPKQVERAKVNARVWGHLIPQIKELQAKETLSDNDSGEIQQMLSELELVRDGVEQFRNERPEYVERFEKLLNKLNKRLQEQACRYVKQTPPTEDEKRMEEIRDELHKIKELVVESKKTEEEAPGSQESPKPASATAEEPKSVSSRVGAFFDAATDMGSSAFSTALYGSAGIASGVLQAGLFPLRVVKGAVGVLLAPNLVQRALGISNFEKGWEELMKSRVCIPDTVGGKQGVAYLGPLKVEEELPELRETVEKPNRGLAAVRGDGNYVPVEIVRPRTVIKTSLEGKTWERNPLWGRVKTCGAEWATGGAKMAFWVLAATYLLGRYGNENGKCADECDLEKPSISGTLSDYWEQLQITRKDSGKCEDLLERNETEWAFLDKSLEYGLRRNFCPVTDAQKLVCNSLVQQDVLVKEQLKQELSHYWNENDCDHRSKSVFDDPCDDKRAANQQTLVRWQNKFHKDLEEKGCTFFSKCERLLKENQVAKEQWPKIFAEEWKENYCDDPEPKPVWQELRADAMKNPWKYPMNFAKTVDEWGVTLADKLSALKEPGKVVLRGLVKMGQTLRDHPTETFHGMEYIALAGFAGSAISNMRTTRSYVGWLASATAATAALTAICALDPLNNQAVALYEDLSGRAVNMTAALLS